MVGVEGMLRGVLCNVSFLAQVLSLFFFFITLKPRVE